MPIPGCTSATTAMAAWKNSSQRGAGSENKCGACAGIVILRHGQKSNGSEIFAQLVILRVTYYAHHLIAWIGFPRRTLNAESTAYRVFAAEDFLRENLIHDRHLRRCQIVALVKIAPGTESCLHGLEIARTRPVEPAILPRSA